MRDCKDSAALKARKQRVPLLKDKIESKTKRVLSCMFYLAAALALIDAFLEQSEPKLVSRTIDDPTPGEYLKHRSRPDFSCACQFPSVPVARAAAPPVIQPEDLCSYNYSSNNMAATAAFEAFCESPDGAEHEDCSSDTATGTTSGDSVKGRIISYLRLVDEFCSILYWPTAKEFLEDWEGDSLFTADALGPRELDILLKDSISKIPLRIARRFKSLYGLIRQFELSARPITGYGYRPYLLYSPWDSGDAATSAYYKEEFGDVPSTSWRIVGEADKQDGLTTYNSFVLTRKNNWEGGNCENDYAADAKWGCSGMEYYKSFVFRNDNPTIRGRIYAQLLPTPLHHGARCCARPHRQHHSRFGVGVLL